jgi:AraC-like DNA-binding protein
MEEDQLTTVPKILYALADAFGTTVQGHRLEIPKAFGSGYCSGFSFGKNLRVLVSHYELHGELPIRNTEMDASRRMLFFKFRNIFPLADASAALPSVLIGTSRANTDEFLSIHTNRATVNIEADAGYLRSLIPYPEKAPVLEQLLQDRQPLLFDQAVFPSWQRIVADMLEPPVGTFRLFFLRVKAEELICRLLMELEKRDTGPVSPLNGRDVQALYTVRAQLLDRPDRPPLIAELAAQAHMSPTKLKRLFRQVFGNSLFRFYQEHRMREAARLLEGGATSVSDVGYRLGFSNLSHFSRVFKQHTGMNPKSFSLKK